MSGVICRVTGRMAARSAAADGSDERSPLLGGRNASGGEGYLVRYARY